MSTTAYWEHVRPEKPLGSWSQLKWLLWPEGDQLIGLETVVELGSPTAAYLRGFRDAMPEDSESRAELAEFLEHLATHKALRVWIDE